ncbi:MAG: hypothetical protein IKH38_01805 [Clostridia bacterium]|nr:hypothetical protein [Clostridia bacterium]
MNQGFRKVYWWRKWAQKQISRACRFIGGRQALAETSQEPLTPGTVPVDHVVPENVVFIGHCPEITGHIQKPFFRGIAIKIWIIYQLPQHVFHQSFFHEELVHAPAGALIPLILGIDIPLHVLIGANKISVDEIEHVIITSLFVVRKRMVETVPVGW